MALHEQGFITKKCIAITQINYGSFYTTVAY